ncbi:aldo/keto reductase [Bradyrhizobium canariense]|uniref:Predicted oxidoreductase n=1 Tax=Bradyrhizobium canariense TaxID=255045 RepID=A0A1H1WPT6_9BRAD|nr:aldo/keto reductase [Bradyrhizobium canariense]SDS98376.1 Predicted oxidoreductase [Bradyrhizobium canariense]
MSLPKSEDAARAGTYRLGVYEVARMGYGAMQLRRCAGNLARAVAVLERAVDLGVDHIDTAQIYGNGFVNEAIGKVLRSRDGIIVASKVGADPSPNEKMPLKPAQRPEQLRASVEDNLRSLGLDQIPVVNLRRLDAGPGLKPEGVQVVDLDDQMAVMIALWDEGKIGAIGLSAIDLNGLKRALPAGIACVQNAYSLVSRQFEDMLALCLEHKIAWVPFFPLGGAFPGWPKLTDQPKVIEIAERLKITPAQLGLTWLLAHAPNMLLIPGTADRQHLEENVAAASIQLAQEALAELDALDLSPAPGDIK